MASSLAAWASIFSGAVSLSAASYTHLRYFRKAPAAWAVLKSVFVEANGSSSSSSSTSDISSSIRNTAFASGLLLSGVTLTETQFGHIGLSLAGDLHAFGEVLIVGGFLAGMGSQLAQNCTLSSSLHAVSDSNLRLAAMTGMVTASATAMASQYLARSYLYLDPAIALNSFDALTVYDGSSMVAFTAAVLAFVACKNQIGAKRSIKPIAIALGSGAGVGAGIGLLNLCHAEKVLSTLSLSASADPLLVLGLGTTLLLHRIIMRKQMAIETPASSKAATMIGSSLCGIGLGLTGLMPASALVGLSSESASFWLFSTSMLAGAGSVYLGRGVRSYYAAKKVPKSIN